MVDAYLLQPLQIGCQVIHARAKSQMNWLGWCIRVVAQVDIERLYSRLGRTTQCCDAGPPLINDACLPLDVARVGNPAISMLGYSMRVLLAGAGDE